MEKCACAIFSNCVRYLFYPEDQGSLRMKIPPGGLVEAMVPAGNGLASHFSRFHDQILLYLDLVCSPEGIDTRSAPFRENPSLPYGKVRLETTVWALVCLQQIGNQRRIEQVRNRALAHIDRHYDPVSQTYQDENARMHESFGAWHIHNDCVARMGLGILGVRARGTGNGVTFLRYHPWAPQPGCDIEAWMHQCWAKDPRAALKEIFQYLVLYCRLQGIHSTMAFDAHVRQIVSFLESRRDPASGYIGMVPGNDLGWAMRGYRNFVINFYWPMGVPEPMLDEMMNSTLACQRDDGLFHDGGMCSNMDAVQLLAEYSLRTGLRRTEVIEACRRCVRSMFENMLLPAIGGFRYNFADCRNIPEGDGYENALITNGTAFSLNALRYWQAIDNDARHCLESQLASYYPA